MFTIRLVEHNAREGKGGLDDPRAGLYTLDGTLDVVAELLARYPTTSAVWATSISAFNPRGGTHENGTTGIPGGRHRARSRRVARERAATRGAPAATAAVRHPHHTRASQKVVAGAEAEAKKNSWNVVIAVLDSGGNVVMLQRMDGAQFGSIEVAKDKAYSAVAFRRPTKAFDDALAQGGANLRILRVPGASPLEGGIPIVQDGKLIGAVGVSGVTSAQDAQIGRAGIENLK
jgi:glc operon protein GlcG